MNYAQLCKHFGLDAIYGLDFETFWADDYTLRKLDTTDYIMDERFLMQGVAVQRGDEKKATVMAEKPFRAWNKKVKWNRCGLLAHHTQFDGLIAAHHFDIHPKMLLDTLSMGSPLLPITVGGSLDRMCKAFKLAGKVKAEALDAVKGVRILSPTQQKNLFAYGGNDVEQTWKLFWKLLPYFPIDELPIIDMTLRMYTEPVIVINKRKMNKVMNVEIERKQAMLDELRLTKEQISKNKLFLPLLQACGVDPPMKVSPTKLRKMEEGDEITIDDFVPALAASDLAFKDLLFHPRKRVRQLVAARFAIKSNILETKSTRLAERARYGPAHVYLNFAKAKTWRWTGGDGMNWQNLTSKRKEGGEALRAALEAPPGHSFIIADQAQIEARGVAWYCGQENIVDAFRRKQDVYKMTASDVYHKSLVDVTSAERFVGKTAVLGCGFQAGGPRFASMLRIGQFGPPVDISDEDAADFVRGYRAANHLIASGWKETQNLIKQAFVGKMKLEHKHGIVYEGAGTTGYIHHIPTGVSMRYDGIQITDRGEVTYISEYRYRFRDDPYIERTKIYGGLMVENRTQFLARLMVADAMRQIIQLRHVRVVMTTHDEIVICVPTPLARIRLREIVEIMTTPPAWAEGIPLGVDAHISRRYDK